MNTSTTPALVVGASGGIGRALCRQLEQDGPVVAVSRSSAPDALPASVTWLCCDGSEAAITTLLNDGLARWRGQWRRVFLCHGLLHDHQQRPEKRLEQVDESALLRSFEVNALLPLRWLRLLWPALRGPQTCVVTAFSARVGSIGDNRSGGWYAYRTAKAALNQLLCTTAVELGRRAPNVKLLAFHPGATATELSRPFQAGLPADYLWSTDRVAQRLLRLTATLVPDATLSFLDRDGLEIPY